MSNPVELPDVKESKSKSLSIIPSGQHLLGIDWHVVGPFLGVASLLGLLFGTVYIGTKLDQSHLRAIEAYKQEKFQRLVDSKVWLEGHSLPSSIDGIERQALEDAGIEERGQLAEEVERHNKRVAKLRREIIIKYFDELKRIQENHSKRKECGD